MIVVQQESFKDKLMILLILLCWFLLDPDSCAILYWYHLLEGVFFLFLISFLCTFMPFYLWSFMVSIGRNEESNFNG